MTKILLVEDDKNLREIYGVRLQAEGYDVASAGDGEEALAMAIKENPQLIVSDVMMPKISGFDMLDILRSTAETKNIKVIMMTALSSEEQRQRGETLGADRYLVKSQVGIEDVVRVVHEVLEDTPAAASAAPEPPISASAPSAPSVQPVTSTPPREAVPVLPRPVAPPSPAPEPVPSPAPVDTPQPTPPAPEPVAPVAPPQPVAPTPAAPQPQQSQVPVPASAKSRTIEPLTGDEHQPLDINQLLDRELAREAGIDPNNAPAIQTTEQERQALEQELADFQATPPPQDGDTPQTS